MLTEAQLLDLLKQFRHTPVETEWMECKEAKESFDFDDLGKYFAAISNEANLRNQQWGWLFFGIADKPPRRIVGTKFKNDPVKLSALKQDISVHTNGLTFQEIYELKLLEGRVLIFQIPAAPAGMPTSWKGHYYGRNGESLASLSTQKYEAIRHQLTILDWSAQICHGATVEDLEELAVLTARVKFENKHKGRYSEDSKEWSTSKFLEKIQLIRNGKLTRAAVLLLGKPNQVQLSVYGKIIDENYSCILMEKSDLSLTEVIALDSVQKKRSISKECVQMLKSKHLVEGRYPNVYVSADVAQVTNKRADYIKNRAFDDEHYEQLILKFIKQYGSASRAEIDNLVFEKLPEFFTEEKRKNKIGYLISKMRNRGLIRNEGSCKRPVWVLIAKNYE